MKIQIKYLVTVEILEYQIIIIINSAILIVDVDDRSRAESNICVDEMTKIL